MTPKIFGHFHSGSIDDPLFCTLSLAAHAISNAWVAQISAMLGTSGAHGEEDERVKMMRTFPARLRCVPGTPASTPKANAQGSYTRARLPGAGKDVWDPWKHSGTPTEVFLPWVMERLLDLEAADLLVILSLLLASCVSCLAGIHPSLHGTHGQFSCLSCHPKKTSPKLRINAMGEMKGTQDLQRSGDIGYGPYSRKPHLVP
ncbi:hypothetical protein J1605_005636 [Eschrichtius robustus]|uniref:Uncharacterized protein n=1 Tax=Eschrichtius robustus TaxID=9764 RepID=A0AB34H9K1_ESCRO|nr:hypothetical protein J1605_005636 [Eschrichtius robustus]